MKKHSHLKIISSALIIAFVFVLTTCSEETGDHGMVWIPEGYFMMGEIGIATPVHRVTLTKGFYMSKYEITQEQFFAIMGNKPPLFTPGNRFPAEGLSWYEAIVFCNKLSIQEGLEPVYIMPDYNNSTDPDYWISETGDIPHNGYTDTYPDTYWSDERVKWNKVEMRGDYPDVPNGYRLPTEAEWEYACRAGADPQTSYNTGNSITKEQANYGKPTDGSEGRTKPVGSYAPNAWGLYDMHGNVNERCWDYWSASYASGDALNPVGASSGADRVFRGGGWATMVSLLRSAFRNSIDPSNRSNNTGFRVVRQ